MAVVGVQPTLCAHESQSPSCSRWTDDDVLFYATFQLSFGRTGSPQSLLVAEVGIEPTYTLGYEPSELTNYSTPQQLLFGEG